MMKRIERSYQLFYGLNNMHRIILVFFLELRKQRKLYSSINNKSTVFFFDASVR